MMVSERKRCARDSDWCDGMICADIGNPGCPNSDVAVIARERGCILPAPCGRGAGANGSDLPCDCEAITDARANAPHGIPLPPDCPQDGTALVEERYERGSVESYWSCPTCGRDFDEGDLGLEDARPPPAA